MPTNDNVLIDVDQREAAIRQRVYAEGHFWSDVPADPDAFVATYFLRPRNTTLAKAGKLISYHMTTGTKHAAPGSLLDICTGRVEGVLPWDSSDKVGLVRVAFPNKLFEHADGKYYTTDILHLMAGEGVCGLWEFAEAKLLDVKIPPKSYGRFRDPRMVARASGN